MGFILLEGQKVFSKLLFWGFSLLIAIASKFQYCCITKFKEI
jgi:hypothetical protein